ncbi:hypothetical protein Scep_022729 [Stephania cephalantha]|uniref:Uncharacterized protein n=1 Tax=Stephania cephalantha TaxID=152367 RepID=A0AAP0I2H4_9MAGN
MNQRVRLIAALHSGSVPRLIVALTILSQPASSGLGFLTNAALHSESFLSRSRDYCSSLAHEEVVLYAQAVKFCCGQVLFFTLVDVSRYASVAFFFLALLVHFPPLLVIQDDPEVHQKRSLLKKDDWASSSVFARMSYNCRLALRAGFPISIDPISFFSICASSLHHACMRAAAPVVTSSTLIQHICSAEGEMPGSDHLKSSPSFVKQAVQDIFGNRRTTPTKNSGPLFPINTALIHTRLRARATFFSLSYYEKLLPFTEYNCSTVMFFSSALKGLVGGI